MIPQSQPRRGELRPRMRNIIGSYRTDRKLVGAASVIRTRDPIITNDVLYRLSYCGTVRANLVSPDLGEAGGKGKRNAQGAPKAPPYL